MAIPYQPTFSLQPKYGFRYGPSTFAPAVTSAATPPPTYGLDGSAAAPPQVLGTQQGVTQSWQDDPFVDNQNQRGYATELGYEKGTQNPLGLVSAVVPGMSSLISLTGYDTTGGGKYTYGNFGTQDTEGNVFGPEGQAFDPATGRATASFGPQVELGDVAGSALGQLGWFGYDESDMITPPSMRATPEQMDMGLTDMSYAGLMNVPGEVSILGALDPNKGYDDIAGGASYNDLSRAGTVTDSLGRAVTSFRSDGTTAAVTTGDAYETAAAQQAYQGASSAMDAGFTEAATQMAGGAGAGAYSGFGGMAPDYNANTYDDDDAGDPTSGPAADDNNFGAATGPGDMDVSNAQSYSNDIDDIEEATGVAYDDPSNDDGDDGGGTHCCTAAEKRGDMSLTEVKKLRAWHRKQSIIWQEGYDIWGKVIADHLVAKSKWQSDRVRDFYNHKIYGKRTLGSVYADIVIYPMSMLIGCGILLSSLITREKNNETKKSF